MPRLKQSDPAFVKMKRLLLGYELNAARLASVLGVSEPTAKKRLDNPETLSLRDLDRINRFGHIPIEEIKSALCR